MFSVFSFCHCFNPPWLLSPNHLLKAWNQIKGMKGGESHMGIVLKIKVMLKPRRRQSRVCQGSASIPASRSDSAAIKRVVESGWLANEDILRGAGGPKVQQRSRPLRQCSVFALSFCPSWIMHRTVLTFLSRVQIYTARLNLFDQCKRMICPRISLLWNNTLSVFLPCYFYTDKCLARHDKY